MHLKLSKILINITSYTYFALLLGSLPAHAESLPLWEAGAGLAVIDYPHYRGSDERQNYILPVPYIIYRGDVLKIDRQSVRGLFFHTDTVQFDFSVNGSVPVKSKDNAARNGMPDLDPTLELGPSLNVSLLGSESTPTRIDLRMPLRAVIASDFSSVHHEGWIFQPQINLDVENVFGQAGLNLGLATGPMFTDRRYNQYIYGVDALYSRADRPAYQAHGGYAGTQLVAALSKRFPRYWAGGFIKWDVLSGAAFADSPLVKTKQYLTAGFGFSWIFSQSDTRVEARQ